MNKKVVASFEMVLMIVGIFAFVYGISLSENIIEKLKEPLIPVVSAQDAGVGCCAVAENGQKCGTASVDNCADDSLFAEGALCAATSFCKRGCCYDEGTGIYDRNVLQGDCSTSWTADPNCNMPDARLGCCVLGTESIFETEKQCEVDTLSLALGSNAIVDWRGSVGEGACLVLSATENVGACILADGNCDFGTEAQCYSSDGDFAEGVLCSSPSLDTSCEMTEETTCVDGQDEVFFVDSCGNAANVYDSVKKDDLSYWDVVVDAGDLCGDDSLNGNAESASCGNCNRFLGGICSSAAEDNFDVDVGDSYCKDASCLVDGVTYKNGESWCVYDGAIGEGNDVVGSRHWKYVCSQGVAQVEPCADYRNQICVQTNTIGDSDVEFRNSVCVANNWRQCINLNGDEDGLEECADSLNCRVDSVDVSEKFKFDVCAPRYPGGFDLNNERYRNTAKEICKMGSQRCTVLRKPDTWGGCTVVVNEECLKEGFAQEMNDFCRGLGDCGGAANIAGEFSGGYSVKNSANLGGGYVEGLKGLATPVAGQYAEMEDYSEYLAAAGWGGPDAVSLAAGDNESGVDLLTVGLVGGGIAGIVAVTSMVLAMTLVDMSASAALSGFFGMAEGAEVGSAWGYGSTAADGTITAGTGAHSMVAGFAGAAIGATVGFMAGMMLGDMLGLSEGGSVLMGVGGAMVGAAAMIQFELLGAGKLLSLGLQPWLFGIGVALILLSLLFFNDDCPPIEVEFECKPWRAPSGGDDCDECNGDPLKPCSEYRCNSLGASCEVVNKGTEDEICINGRANDSTPPILRPDFDVISGDYEYDVSEDGFVLTSSDGGCIDAYENVVFGITTDEASHCKFDLEMEEFEEMDFDLGGNLYLYNHTTAFSLPDPSYGQSQGSNWTGDLNLYIKCRDTNGRESPGFYEISMCVVEGEDRTAPLVRATSPTNGDTVGFETASKNVTIITNELAECRWDSADVDYFVMGNSMECNDELTSPSNVIGYVCSGILPTTDGENAYYVRCMDQPWLNDTSARNANTESFVYTLNKPEAVIAIDWISPSDDIESSTSMTTIDLEVQTSGGGAWHHCSYSFSGYDNMIEMFETGADRNHVQSLNRPSGHDKIYIKCSDETGDSAEGWTEFRVIHDTSTPQVSRIWQTNGNLYFILNEEAECRYSTQTCNFVWSSATSTGNAERHSLGVVNGKTYYIKCRDEFGNSPDECSVQASVI